MAKPTPTRKPSTRRHEAQILVRLRTVDHQRALARAATRDETAAQYVRRLIRADLYPSQKET